MTSKSGTDESRPSLLTGLVILALTVGLGVVGGLVAHEVTASDPGPPVEVPTGGGGTMMIELGTLGFLAMGGIVGLVVGYSWLGVPWARRIIHGLLGLYVGALAGLMVYVVGFVTAAAPSAWTSVDAFLAVAAQALFTANPWVALSAGLGAIMGLMVERYAWRFQGLLAFVSLAAIIFGFIGYSLFVTLPQVPPEAFPLSLTLFLAETGLLLLVLVYAFYPMDMMGRKRWHRTHGNLPFDPTLRPKVAFHVPTFNEPPEMVKETLRSLLDVEYPEDWYEIMVLDDSTDQAYIEPVREFCEANDITYIHRGKRDGYKAGALNVGLEFTSNDVDLIAVIDADYQIDPDYLQHTVGYFTDNELGFLQTPQDYRNHDDSFLTKYYYYADSYFYQAVLPSRNEADAIIFCGTMGIVTKEALEDVNGWSNDHVTEDAELATRLLGAGYTSLYINESFGKGLIPETYEGYRAQHHRWALGGGQLLRTRFTHIVSPRFSLRQKFDQLAGIVHWYDGVLLITIALILTLIAMGDLVGLNVMVHHQQAIWLVGLIPLFLLFEGLTRTQLALSEHFELSMGESVRVMGMWFSVKFSNMWGAIKGLLGLNIHFARTPKAQAGTAGRREAFRRATAASPFETGMAAMLAVLALAFTAKTTLPLLYGLGIDTTRLFLSFWMALFSLAFAAAPIYAYLAHRGTGVREGIKLQEQDASISRSAPQGTGPTAASTTGLNTTDTRPPEDQPGMPGEEPSAPSSESSPWRLPSGWPLVGLIACLVLAFALRVKDPLTTFIIGAEDPYTHMMRTWDLLLAGVFPEAYPPGFAVLLVPFAMLGTDAFYWFARFAPPFFGVVEVLGLFYVGRYLLSDGAGLAGGFIGAVVPENIVRTNLLFPTALSLALLPFAFLLLFRSLEGHRGSQVGLGVVTVVLLATQPWVVGLALPPFLVYWLLTAKEHRGKVAVGCMVLAGALVATFHVLPGTWNPFPALIENVGYQFSMIAAEPSSLWTDLPRHVDFAHMLTYPVIIAAALGAGVAFARRSRLGVFALTWTLMLLPLVLVDWFDQWFLPHRTVAFMTLGVALLGAVLFDGLSWTLPDRDTVRRVVAAGLAVSLVVMTVPAAADTHPWYRIYEEDDYAVWSAVEAEDPPLVITASWQTHNGYRALTANPASYDEGFFYDGTYRDSILANHPDLIVVYNERNAEETPDGFLQDWEILATQGSVTAYQPPAER